MTYETAFSLAGVLAMAGWLLLAASPWVPKWSDLIAGTALPVVLSLGYFALLVLPSDQAGDFGSLAGVMEVFSNEQAMLAGWVHYLAFDLFIGAWVCRQGRLEGIRFVFILPCLPLIFLFGPLGFLAFQAVKALNRFVRHKGPETGQTPVS